MKLPPSHIEQKHRDEWVIGSGIDPLLTSLNEISLQDYEPYDYLLYGLPDSERRNDGRLRDRWLRRYAHIEHGGWWCSGVDVLTGEDSEWGCFKPNLPRQEIKYNKQGHFKKAKLIKYEQPPQTNPEIFALHIPLHLWKAIALRYDVPLPENITVTPEGRAIGFWAWVIAHPEIPLIITEGAKKAGAIITAHYVAIGLSGIYGGYRQPKDSWGNKIGLPYLIPQLKVFAQQGREIIFAFDNDSKPSTIKNVRTAIANTGELYAKENCQISTLAWEYPEKGVDDLIVARGQDCFHELYKNRIPLEKDSKVIKIALWQQQQEVNKNRTWQQLTNLTAKPWLEVNTPHLDQIGLENKLERGHIYLVLAAKSTGKTKAVKPLIDNFSNIYSWFNRIALGREECHKLGLDYKDELGSFQGFLKAGFCANSAYQFSPTHLKNNGLLLGDESDQLFSYLFESICNKDGIRPAILKAFEAQLHAAIAFEGMALFMSADNSDLEYQFLKQIAPENCEVRVIVNHYKPPKGKVNFDVNHSPDGSIDELVKNLQNGVPCFVIDDVKNGVKGCKSIAEYIRNTLPELADKIVEINSDTSGSEEIRDYLKNINEASKDTLLLISSPSVISGISIENGHFQKGYGFYNGVLTTKEASQSLVRVRGLQNLTVWAALKGFTWAGDRSVTPEEIKNYYQRNYAQNSKYLSSFDVDYNPLTDEWSSPWFELYCKYAAYRNLSMMDLRSRLRQKLEEEGYEIVEVNPLASEEIETELKKSWGSINLERAIAISTANICQLEELERLSNSKEPLTPEQQRALEKTLLLKQYGQPLIDSITYADKHTGELLTGYPALYLKDNGGKWYRQLKQLYYLLDDSDEAIASDRRKESQQEFHGLRFAADLKWDGRKRQCRKHLGLDKLLDLDWKYPEDYQCLAEKSQKYHRDIKDSIGLSVKKLTPGQIYSHLISQLGLLTESKQIKQRTPDGKTKTIRIKRITPESWKLAQLFLAHREGTRLQNTTGKSSDQKPEIAVTPSPVFLSRESGEVLPDQSLISTGLQPSEIPKNLTRPETSEIVSNNTVELQSATSQNTTKNPLSGEEVNPRDTESAFAFSGEEVNLLDTEEAILDSVLDSEEAIAQSLSFAEIADLASILELVDSPEALRGVQEVPEFTRKRLQRASRLLSSDKLAEIERYAIINQQRNNSA